eukprot:TRINITY_DN87180_c0_g1_i1.p1 TRINITY_DN87180_c0_g1~~TRINITY_DN87180_c0_g1_i1.p1  ORF type:complete len:171 (+),score=27.11 TRINITY_DN87180_c0_g1_i1:88-600(+)
MRHRRVLGGSCNAALSKQEPCNVGDCYETVMAAKRKCFQYPWLKDQSYRYFSWSSDEDWQACDVNRNCDGATVNPGGTSDSKSWQNDDYGYITIYSLQPAKIEECVWRDYNYRGVNEVNDLVDSDQSRDGTMLKASGTTSCKDESAAQTDCASPGIVQHLVANKGAVTKR